MKTSFLLAHTLLFSLPVIAQDGALDADFSGDGMHFAAPGAYLSRAYDVAQLPTGYLLVAGDAYATLNNKGAGVVKYVPDGEPDAGFGDAGKVFLPTGAGALQTCRRMALLDDGSILLAGSSQQVAAGQVELLLIRLHPDGSPDHTFAVAGVAHVALGDLWANTNDMAVQDDGMIVITGDVTVGGTTDLFVARVTADGGFSGDELDPGFAGGQGYLTLHPGGPARGHSVSLDDAGNITVLGVAFTPTPKPLLARYLPDGSPDLDFGTDGLLLLDDITLSTGTSVSMIRHQDGYFVSGKTADDLVIRRLNADGSTDTDWGAGGTALLDGSNWSVSSSVGIGVVMAMQADGKLLLGDSRPSSAGGGALLARLTADGALDETFGTDGLVVTEAAQGINRLLIQQDHRIVAVGHGIEGGSSKFFTARYHSGLHVGIGGATPAGADARLMPNPAHDHCDLSLTLDHADRLTAVVQDAQGRTVRTLFSNEPFAAGAQRRSLDLDGMAPGAYLLVLSNASGRVAATGLIKQ